METGRNVMHYALGDNQDYEHEWSKAVLEYLENGYSSEDSKSEVEVGNTTYKILKREKVTAFYDADGNTLFDVENDRLKEEYEAMDFSASGPQSEMGKVISNIEQQAFEQALRAEGLSFICEAKKASPSKGLIAPDFPYVQIAQDYEAGGAAAISCLTEPFWFQGSDRYLEEIVQKVSIPVLRKDFTCDEYMIYQAKAMGAAAVLLICSCLDEGQLKAYHQLAEELGISALVETHSEEEILTADRIGAKIIGVNNRNLKDFTVDINNSIRLRELVDPKTVFVSESGIKGGEDMKALYKNGTDAVLIGELLMRAEDRKKKLAELRMETRKGC